MTAPLAGLRVLDLSRVLAGPWASQLLADLGAEVIKIERPGTGDDTRAWGPPFLRDHRGGDTSESAYYLAANRGKKSVAIDFTRPRGQELVRQLAAASDVLLENYKVGGLAKYGLDYERLHRTHPPLIYCSITGFGQTGPYRERPGYDFMIQAMGGLMSITGEADDRPGGGPQKAGVALADVLTGLYATIAVLAAVAERQRSGRGQHIDLALLDVQVACLANQAMNYLVTGEPPHRRGNSHPNIVPYQAFATRDGHIVITVGNDRQFATLCRILDCPELANDPRFVTNAARVRHRAVLSEKLESLLARRRSDEWLTRLQAVGISCSPINTLDKVFSDPQVQNRGMCIRLPHPLAGEVPLVGNPIRFSESPIDYTSAPPLLGQHTTQVLSELLAVSDTELAELRQSGVIQ